MVSSMMKKPSLLLAGFACSMSLAGLPMPGLSFLTPLSAHAGTVQSYQSGADLYATVSVDVPQGTKFAQARQGVLILVDTSASQVGKHRDDSIAITRQILESLPSEVSFNIWAIDQTILKTNESAISNSPENRDASLSTLSRRFPAGTTNLLPALIQAQAFAQQTQSSVIYIGDGMCTANLIESADLQQVCQDYRHQQIQFHAVSVGPFVDAQLLGILAYQTGGVVVKHHEENPSADAARVMAQAFSAQVAYPQSMSISQGAILPASPVPFRTDRDNLYLVKTTTQTQQTAHISVQFEDLSGSVVENVSSASASQENAYLQNLWMLSEASHGLALPLAGSELMQCTRETLEHHFQPVSMTTTINAQPLEDRAGPPTASQSDEIQQYKAMRKAAGEKLRLEVKSDIEEAQILGQSEPQEAIGVLKRSMASVNATKTALDPNVKEELLRELDLAIGELNVRKGIIEQNQIQLERKRAESEATQRIVDQMAFEQERLQQLVEKVRALMKEGLKGRDVAFHEAESVARIAVETEPGNGPATAALFNAEAAGQLADAFRLRSLRADKFLATLTQVEESHVPFPDEPPVIYPPVEVWNKITQERRKWNSTDLKRNSPNEERIAEALKDETQVEFVDTPLRDAIEYLQQVHNITIIIEQAALDDEGIPVDEPINLVLSGITLRSALKIMLEKLGLTYVIEDEVMKITTQTAADEKSTTRVYPVADLTVPLRVIQSGGGGGGIGGQGGGGQQGGGGFGGGGQQGGGGFGGGGGGFGGGGFNFSVPAQPVAPQVPAVNDLKKKH